MPMDRRWLSGDGEEDEDEDESEDHMGDCSFLDDLRDPENNFFVSYNSPEGSACGFATLATDNPTLTESLF